MAFEINRDQLRTEVAALLRVDEAEMDEDDNLLDYGLDSIRLMQLVQRWREAGLDVSFAALAERPQLSYWWSLIAQAIGAPRR